MKQRWKKYCGGHTLLQIRKLVSKLPECRTDIRQFNWVQLAIYLGKGRDNRHTVANCMKYIAEHLRLDGRTGEFLVTPASHKPKRQVTFQLQQSLDFSAPKPVVLTAARVRFINSQAFLDSYEWRKLRTEAFKKYGRRCQCCGATLDDGVKMNVDHIKCRKKYPELALDINNTQILCGPCNHGKGNWDDTDWR